ncbi:MAG: hypothetical protein ABIG28_01290 [archaeon]
MAKERRVIGIFEGYTLEVEGEDIRAMTRPQEQGGYDEVILKGKRKRFQELGITGQDMEFLLTLYDEGEAEINPLDKR